MEKLDLKDRKILYHLDLDSRQSFSQIGKKVGLHKNVVAYRVKNLQDKGIIKKLFFNQLFQIIDNLSSKFPDTIKNYTYIGLTKSHKLFYLPEIKKHRENKLKLFCPYTAYINGEEVAIKFIQAKTPTIFSFIIITLQISNL